MGLVKMDAPNVKRIYADNCATTVVSEAALAAMMPYFRECFGNPSAIYSYGQEAKKALEGSRRAVADALGALNNEIYFTSGGTEGDNWALYSACELRAKKGRHIITSAIEHKAVLGTLEKMRSRGFEVTVLQPDSRGQITAAQLSAALRCDTVLVSIMLANNVAGTVLPVKELCAAAHEAGALFHTDAVQAAAHIPVNVRELGVDMLSISAHKFHGPKGVGALFCRLPLVPSPYITGGGQEKGQRAGTENVSGVVGMAAALSEGVRDMAANTAHIQALRAALVEQTLKIPGAFLTGDPERRLPGHASFVFEGVKHSAYVITMLNEAGICASSGSACSASSKEAPHVLTALGYADDIARSAVRISLSHYNTAEEIDIINEKLPRIISEVRAKKETLV
ncbi:MAG: cysteine desulfurase [Spirochaetaceae bacterium]|jgi:cysteine desulfurase|nr:cysteine desulfurase [Spirochaetaceae bacterium]